ncbi:uncharacterized protein LOC110847727 [Folsomia candida]|uniref:Uncharacterized protein n=1 Tax=Folsomia candida TaxID=158441 RepID=A0A226EN47_FOLCA|nr:uncharacterized protein LOC110847727 [Folsomia candida]OXA58710.1 hypothetical protein Fcan01_07008 [Folsomia candida]
MASILQSLAMLLIFIGLFVHSEGVLQCYMCGSWVAGQETCGHSSPPSSFLHDCYANVKRCHTSSFQQNGKTHTVKGCSLGEIEPNGCIDANVNDQFNTPQPGKICYCSSDKCNSAVTNRKMQKSEIFASFLSFVLWWILC